MNSKELETLENIQNLKQAKLSETRKLDDSRD